MLWQFKILRLNHHNHWIDCQTKSELQWYLQFNCRGIGQNPSFRKPYFAITNFVIISDFWT